VRLLNGAPLFDMQLDVRFSKHATLVGGRNDAGDEQGRHFHDYSQSPLNRFRRHPVATSKHVCMPSATLYFSNVPADVDEPALAALFAGAGLAPPRNILFFQVGHATRSGLVDMGSVAAAVGAVVMLNHAPFTPTSSLKLSFTTNVIKTDVKTGASDASNNDNSSANANSNHNHQSDDDDMQDD
jgi:hypothetical protein